jgi:hypothetical protein
MGYKSYVKLKVFGIMPASLIRQFPTSGDIPDIGGIFCWPALVPLTCPSH